jgi:predicted TIM-barrel fold metal-dependent hydrolase
VIIDCHGHYTTAPESHTLWREAQVAAFKAGGKRPGYPRISDDEIRESIETNQLRLIAERGTDMTIFSPRASTMAHHIGDESVSRAWAQVCNDLIKRVVDLFPRTFFGVCQLPQSAGVSISGSIDELERCVNELGFVGCNLNPDPSGGLWTAPPLIDKAWYPFYEKMVELDVPAMIHVSGSCNPNFHATGAHYLNADTTAFMQFLQGDLFKDFPELRFVIPHGGGAVPYHWGAIEVSRTCWVGHRCVSTLCGTSISTRASITKPVSTCCSTSLTSKTFSSVRRWSEQCAASIRKPGTTSTTRGATSKRLASALPTGRRSSPEMSSASTPGSAGR